MDMSSINSASAGAEAYREEQLKKQRENERDTAIQQTMVNTYNQIDFSFIIKRGSYENLGRTKRRN